MKIGEAVDRSNAALITITKFLRKAELRLSPGARNDDTHSDGVALVEQLESIATKMKESDHA